MPAPNVRSSGSPPGGALRLPGILRGGGLPLALLAVGAALVLGVGYWWFVQRVEVESNQLLVLIRKVGEPLPPRFADQVVLYPELVRELGDDPAAPRFKGVVFEPRAEGRYFYDPLFWERRIEKATFIAESEVGVLIRKYGRPLPPGKTVASEPDERGPLAEVLKPGRYNLNPYAFEVRRVAPVRIPPGSVGVQTLYSGADPKNANEYVVGAGERGVQPDVLPPGLYYNNPFVRRIDLIDVRSHTIDMHGTDAIRFPSNDSFDILIDATVEYAIRQDKAPYVMVAIGDHAEIREKLILPYARSLCRIEGSKLAARDFISGEMRSTFQNRVFEGLREQSFEQGIEIRATLIRKIEPPAEIAGPISDRQVAGQQIKQYENEIKVAESEARLVEQQEMQKQNQAVGAANREVVSIVTEAQQRREVALIEARQRLEVARLALEAARQTAAALLARGAAEAEVALLGFEARARPVESAVAAFGDGETYAQFHFYQKLGPALKSVLATTDGPFADIFRALGDSAARPSRPAARAHELAPERAEAVSATEGPASDNRHAADAGSAAP